MATPFSNSMQPDNEPEDMGGHGSKAPSNHGTDMDAHNSQSGDAESRGGDHRESQDNGTGGRGFNVQGANTIGDHPTIPDQFAPPGSSGDFYQFDMGIADGMVGHDGNVLSYGLEGPAAGGGDERNTKA